MPGHARKCVKHRSCPDNLLKMMNCVAANDLQASKASTIDTIYWTTPRNVLLPKLDQVKRFMLEWSLGIPLKLVQANWVGNICLSTIDKCHKKTINPSCEWWIVGEIQNGVVWLRRVVFNWHLEVRSIALSCRKKTMGNTNHWKSIGWPFHTVP